MHGCMDAWMYAWMSAWKHGCMHPCMHAARMHPCMHAALQTQVRPEYIPVVETAHDVRNFDECESDDDDDDDVYACNDACFADF